MPDTVGTVTKTAGSDAVTPNSKLRIRRESPMPPLGRSEYRPMTDACPEPRPYFGPRSLPLRGPCGFPLYASLLDGIRHERVVRRGAPAVELGGIDARRLTSASPSPSAAAAQRRSVRGAVAASVGTVRRTAPAAGVVGPAVRYAVLLQEVRVANRPGSADSRRCITRGAAP